jgi:hypothetical protein
MLAPLVDLPSLRRPPPDILRRLRAIRPNAEVLWAQGRWMLGEVRPNEEKRRRAARMVHEFLKRRSLAESTAHWESWDNQVFLREARLLMAGFAWIHDYADPLDDFIVQDYQRRVWKEDVGLLDLEWQEKMKASDGTNSVLRRVSIMLDKLHSEGRSIYRHTVLHRRAQRPASRRPQPGRILVRNPRIVHP